MRLFSAAAAAALAGLTGYVSAQSVQFCDPQVGGLCFQSFTDPVHGIRIAVVLPPGNSTEFIAVIEAPIAIKWASWASGGGMQRNPLYTAWPYGSAIVSNVLWANDYLQPLPYTGSKVTTIAAATSVGSAKWRWTFRCQNCTTWTGGGMDVLGSPVMGWAMGLTQVNQPSNPNSTFAQHDDFGLWGMQLVNAHDANYNTYLNGGTVTTTATTTTTKTTTTTTPTASATPYDYIVVGAGAGGLVTADRLSQAGKKVLLIERGGPSTAVTGGKDVPPWGNADDTRYDVPGLFEDMFSGNTYWWCKDVNYFAGCVIGGGTSVNAALYWYPTDDDFSIQNGWPAGWQNVSEFLPKMSARMPSTDTPSPDGKRYLQETYGVTEQILKPMGFRNLTINDNRNQKEHVYGHTAYNFVNGKRTGPVATYLQTSKARSNFKFLSNVYVQSIVRKGAQITGVQTNDTSVGPNGFIPLTAKGRVILSAGAFGTNRLLLMSGIGPADQIQVAQSSALGSLVPATADWIKLSQVGYNVQDNPSINLVFAHPNVDSYDNWSHEILWDSPRPADAALYKKSNSGVFAGASPRINFWQALSGSDAKTRWVQGTVRPGGYGINSTIPYDPSKLFLMTVYLSYGLTSRGRIGIDAALKGKALVQPWFQDPKDKAVMVQAVTGYLNSAKTVSNLTTVMPDLTATTVQSFVDNYNKDSMCSNHWIGSAKIGTTSSNSVVDPNTKVWNTNNLFIVDASIMPSLPYGNPHAAIMLSAEMAVAKILALAGGA